MENGLIKTEFDFGWKEWQDAPHYAHLALEYQKGSVVDVGCATCELYKFLRNNGWKDKYYGMDNTKYDISYPSDINLIIGDASETEIPKVDTVILYNILEHVDEPLLLLEKSIKACRKNVLINIPKRNEEMWYKYGIFEPHQLDKTHKHCGFIKKEIYNLVALASGEIRTYKEFGEIDAMKGMPLWNNVIPRVLNRIVLKKIFSSKTFYHDIWCEVTK
jgi:2-polyprenyl-3-methyl-5-hydroxy-6-metoxy-1,4-benzoquinol methylase